MTVRPFAPVLLTLLLACSGTRSAADLPPTDAVVPPPEQIGDAPTPADAAPATLPVDAPPGSASDTLTLDGPVTPESLYGACRDRLEGPQGAGECTTDADCAKVGCSQEACVPAKLAGEFVTTCEILPCFQAVDTCGCHEGMCSWTLKSELPGPGRKLPLPPK